MNHSARSCLLPIAAALLLSATVRGDDWPQWLGPQRDGVWRETGILDKFPESGPTRKWHTPIGGGYAGPAVAGGKVYVTDFVADADAKADADPLKPAAKHGKERVLCLDEADGSPLWKHEDDVTYTISYSCGPRTTPLVRDGKVYTVGAEGLLLCLDAAKGDLVWSHDLKKEYSGKAPMWGFTGHPLLDGDKLICLVGGKDSVAVAFNRADGKEIWRSLSAKEPGYAPPTMIEAGGKRQLVIWDADSVNALDPENGKPYWSVPMEPKYGMSVTTPRKLGDALFVSSVENGAMLLKLASDKPAAEVVWRGEPKEAVYCVFCTPFLEDGYIYGVDTEGQLRCVRLSDGERKWETLAPTTGGERLRSATGFLVKNGDRFFLFNEKGDLIIAKLTPEKYEEVSRAHLIEPTGKAFGRDVVWTHPAFADRCVFVRNDKEIACFSLAEAKPK